MALIVDPSSWTRPKLLDLLAEHRDGLLETLGNLDAWPHPVVDPASFRTARDLLSDALALGEGLPENAPVALLARTVNVQYDAMLAAIDLMKSHSALASRVPRARKPRRRTDRPGPGPRGRGPTRRRRTSRAG